MFTLKKICAVTIVLISLVATPALAISRDTLTRSILDRLDPIGEEVYQQNAYEDGSEELFLRVTGIINIALGVVGLIVITLIIYGGFLYMTAAGNDDRVSDARSIIYRALVGMIIILSSYAITAALTSIYIRILEE